MATIRRYIKGEVKDIELNDIGLKDWADNDDETCIDEAESYTIEIEKYKCVVCIHELQDKTYYFWFTVDRRMNPIYIKYVKKILDKVAERGKVWSLSHEGNKQKKMHEFLGAKFVRKEEGRIRWEKYLKV